MANNRILIGAYQDDENGYQSGSSYVFNFDSENNIWEQSQKIKSGKGPAGARLGTSISVFGNQAIIGAYGDFNILGKNGAAFMFDFVGQEWILKQILTVDTGGAFGFSVSLNLNRALIVAYGNSCAAYVFDFNNEQ